MNFARRAASAVVVSIFVSTAAAQMRFEAHGSGVRLIAGDGSVAHGSAGPIAHARVIALPDSRASVATWDELGTGTPVPHYAISLDGRHVDALKATSYELDFRRASFDPLREVPSFDASPLAQSDELYIVQYVTQPLSEYTDALSAAGARIYDFVESHAHLVRMSEATRTQVAALPFVRWVGTYHAEFRLEPQVLADLRAGALGVQRYNVLVFERGAAQQELVAAHVLALGGEVHLITPPGFRMEVTLTPDQLASIVSLDEVRYVDRWGAPEQDIDLARELSGANYVEATPGDYRGQGVSAEVLDGGCDLSHPDFTGEVAHGGVPSGDHGTCTAGILFGTGAGNAQARGAMPLGRLVAGYYGAYSGGNRYAHTAELVNPSLTYKCVLQSNSWGSPLTTSYDSMSAEFDDIIVINDFLILQSQSNANSTLSRPQAWAKNVIAVGGINHENTLTVADDNWGGASIGPAADQRIKPDLAHFYDSTLCTDVVGGGGYSGTNYNSSFGGTSGATPITAGHAGLFYEMWQDGIFGNTPVGATPFECRPHFTLAKAALINTATQWTFSGTGHNLTRTHQGWGRVDLKTLYDLRAKTFFVNQTDIVSNLGVVTYNLDVSAGEPALKVTLVYRDAMGAVSPSQHRKNDLTLKLTSPGGTLYWGNNGLSAGMWSTAGGSANVKDTVENVFVQNPAAGTWVVEVRGDNVNTNPATNTPASSTDFALWATGITGAASCSSPVVYCTAKITSAFTLPQIGWTGTPSVAGNNFAVTMGNSLPNKNGILFHGGATNSAPFQGGELCAQPPLVRSPVTTTDGAGFVSQALALDVSMVGTTRFFQWWFRDPASTFTTGLSDGLEVTFCD